VIRYPVVKVALDSVFTPLDTERLTIEKDPSESVFQELIMVKSRDLDDDVSPMYDTSII
jgi:hypothetical protein